MGETPAQKQTGRKGGQLEHLNLEIPESFFDPMTDEELREWGLL